MVIRPATPADGPAFVTLVRALAEFEQLPPPDPKAEDRLIAHAFADPPLFELWVAELDTELDQRIGAYAAFFITYSTFLARPTLYLEDLFVHPLARRRGVATAMLAALESEARSRGCGRFEWSVLDWNRGAQSLYDRFGARMLDDWRIMRKTL